MAVQSKDDLQTQKDTLLASAKPGGILASEHRIVVGDGIDSLWAFDAEYVPGNLVPARTAVLDSGGMHLSLRETSERAAPQICGDLATDIPDSAPWTPGSDLEQSIIVHEYTLSIDQQVNIEAYVPDNTDNLPNRFYVIIQGPNPGDQPISKTLPSIATGSPSWRTIDFSNTNYRAGTKITVYQAVLNSGSTGSSAFNCNYAGQNLEVPAAGQWSRSSDRSSINISTTDNAAGDISGDLALFEPGTRITFTNVQPGGNGAEVFDVISSTDNGTYYTFQVNSVLYSGNFNTNDNTGISADYPVSPTANYPQITDYWLTNQPSFATVQASKILNGVETLTDDAYGIRLKSLEVCFSDDWVQVSGGAATLSAGAQRFVQGVYFSNVAQTIASGNDYTRFPIAFEEVNPFRDPDQISVNTTADGEFSFTTDGQAQANLSLTFTRTSGGSPVSILVGLEFSLDGGTTWLAFGDPVELAIRNNDVFTVAYPFTIANAETTDLYRFTWQLNDSSQGVSLVTNSDPNWDFPPAIAPQLPTNVRSATMNIQFYPSQV